MKKYVIVIEKLNEELKKIQLDKLNVSQKAEASILIISAAISKLRKLVMEYGFPSAADEILFFKKLKPDVFSKLVYYTHTLEIELNKSINCDTEHQKFILEKKIIFKNY